MQQDAYRRYMLDRNLAEKTRQSREYALKRIERNQGVDLDDEFARDGLQSLADLFSYSTSDARSSRPNPTRMDIDPEKLLTHLRWYLSHIQDYRRFKGAAPEEAIQGEAEQAFAAEVVTEAVTQTFGLERDLQSALRAHLDQLEPGLQVADGGSEVRVDAGFIDILAKDRNGVWTVIELKAELARPAVVAQILAYMGCIATEKQSQVRGILVAADYDQRVVYAAKAVPNLLLKRYSYKFEFN